MPPLTQTVLPVLELFQGPLAGMRFGDVDADALALLTSNVDRAAAEVAEAELRLAELRRALAVEEEALLIQAQRALAYARVYAESHEELLTVVEGISLPRPNKPRRASAGKAPGAEASPAPLSPATETELVEPPSSDGHASSVLAGDAEATESSGAQQSFATAREPAGRKTRGNRRQSVTVAPSAEGDA